MVFGGGSPEVCYRPKGKSATVYLFMHDKRTTAQNITAHALEFAWYIIVASLLQHPDALRRMDQTDASVGVASAV